MNLGPFTLDIKEVPESMSKERVLSCLALFEESGGVEVQRSMALAHEHRSKRTAFIKRIKDIPAASCGYETFPRTKIFRTTWSSREEPPALARTSSLTIDGHMLPLCRYGQDVCSICCGKGHLTSGHERHELSLQKHNITEENNGTNVDMSTTLRPPFFKSRTRVGGDVATRLLNGRFNSRNIVSSLRVPAKHRGQMATRGIYALEPLTAVELGNGLKPTPLDSNLFVDLSTRTSLVSTIQQDPRWVKKDTQHLLPNLENQFYQEAIELLDAQYGYGGFEPVERVSSKRRARDRQRIAVEEDGRARERGR